MTGDLVQPRALSAGPRFHWFGYYDKLQFDPTDRYVLGMAVDFEHRAPAPADAISVGMIDLQDGDSWRELGATTAWCWQQGCMLQWLPNSNSQVIFNERRDDGYACRVLDVFTGRSRTLDMPIYALSPDGRWGICADFRRINDMRPGYGYQGLADPWADQLAPAESGIWRVDLATGKAEMMLSIADIAAVDYPGGDISGAKHYFNHLLVGPSGRRFVFLHRWRYPGQAKWSTRMVTAAIDGSEVRVVDHSGWTSHFYWRDDDHILAFTNPPGAKWGFYLFDERKGSCELVMDSPNDGHCVYLQDGRWILCDTYPRGNDNIQELYLHHVPSGRHVTIGQFPSDPQYAGQWRCDLHARPSRNGRFITIDSTHENKGRQIYLLDIGEIVGA